MRCDEVTDRLADRLDDLLDESDRRAVDDHLAACPGCAGRREEVAALCAFVYAPEEVAAPPVDLPDRIAAAALAPRRRWVPVLLRYVAVFLAGVGVALAFRPEPRVVVVTADPPAVSSEVPAAPSVAELSRPRVPRRIR
jgi:predicted anti-sigma-YlaC factor YlaD